jgi:hypothetical protein
MNTKKYRTKQIVLFLIMLTLLALPYAQISASSDETHEQPEITIEAKPESIPESIPEPTPEITQEPTPKPTAEPTSEPTSVPTPEPTSTPEPTAEPEQTEPPEPEPTLEPETTLEPEIVQEPVNTPEPEVTPEPIKPEVPEEPELTPEPEATLEPAPIPEITVYISTDANEKVTIGDTVTLFANIDGIPEGFIIYTAWKAWNGDEWILLTEDYNNTIYTFIVDDENFFWQWSFTATLIDPYSL